MQTCSTMATSFPRALPFPALLLAPQDHVQTAAGALVGIDAVIGALVLIAGRAVDFEIGRDLL